MKGSTRTSRPGQRALLACSALTGLVAAAFTGTAFAEPSPSSPAPAASGHWANRTGDGYHEHRNADGETDVNVCSYATPPGVAHCNARVRTDVFAAQLGSALSAQGVAPAAVPSSAAYGPPSSRPRTEPRRPPTVPA